MKAGLLCLLTAMATLTLAVGCAKKRPPGVVYINRPLDLSPAEEQAVAVAKNEVSKWDLGAQVVDYRVQRHSQGYTVSLLISGAVDPQGNPLFDSHPVRNVELNREFEVVGYHISR